MDGPVASCLRVEPATVRLADGRRVATGAIYCIGRNYLEHALELGNPRPARPVVFLKSTAALRELGAVDGAAPGAMAYPDEEFHHEAELVLLLGRSVALGARAGWEAVAGVSLGLDLTRRAVQDELKRAGLPWTAAKSFAGSAIVGDLVGTEAIGDPAQLEFRLAVRGEPRQHGRLRDMLFGVPELLAHLASAHPLRPGDLVYTGTPPGVGPVRRGDEVCLTLLREGTAVVQRLEGRL